MDKNISLNVAGESVRGVIENFESENIIILVPGFTGDWCGPADIFVKLSMKLQESGYAVCRFNFRGTPHSDGRFEEVTIESETEDLKSIIGCIEKEGYKRITLLGESMGGTVISSLQDFGSFDSLIFWYSAFNLYDTDLQIFLNGENQRLLLQQGFVESDGCHVGTKFINEIKSVDTYSQLESISCPVLFLHGDCDTEVPLKQSERAFDMISSEKKEIGIINGADHCFKNEQDEAIEKTVEFLKKNIYKK